MSAYDIHLLQAMKVENMLKIKEEFDYKSLAKRLEIQLDKLIAENERQQKAYEDEVEGIRLEAQRRISEAERDCAEALKVALKFLSFYLNQFFNYRMFLKTNIEESLCNILYYSFPLG